MALVGFGHLFSKTLFRSTPTKYVFANFFFFTMKKFTFLHLRPTVMTTRLNKLETTNSHWMIVSHALLSTFAYKNSQPIGTTFESQLVQLLNEFAQIWVRREHFSKYTTNALHHASVLCSLTSVHERKFLIVALPLRYYCHCCLPINTSSESQLSRLRSKIRVPRSTPPGFQSVQRCDHPRKKNI